MFLNSIKSDMIFELEKIHLNLSHFYALEKSYNQIFFKVPENIVSLLVRKNFMLEDGKLTEEGKKLYELLSDPDFSSSSVNIKKEIKKVKAEYDARFLEWWTSYPASDAFTKNNMFFPGTRSFRVNKDSCQKKYIDILNGGDTTHEEMVKVIKYIVYLKQKETYNPSDNKMRFIQNTETFLNQGSFYGYIEMMKADKKWNEYKQEDNSNNIANSTLRL